MAAELRAGRSSFFVSSKPGPRVRRSKAWEKGMGELFSLDAIEKETMLTYLVGRPRAARKQPSAATAAHVHERAGGVRTFRCQCCGLAGPADLIAAANIAFLGSCDLGRGEVTRPDAGAQACRSAHGTCRSIATVTPHIPRDTPGSCPRGPHAVLPASSAVSRAPIGTSGGPPSRPLDQLDGDHQRTDEGKRAEAMGDRAVGVPSHPLCQTASTTDGSMHSTTVSSRSRILPRLSRGIKPQAQDAAVQNVFPQASGAV